MSLIHQRKKNESKDKSKGNQSDCYWVGEPGKVWLRYAILKPYEIVEKVGEAHAVLGKNC